MDESSKDLKELLKRSLTTIKELKSKLAKFREPIAIIGMGCRLPGNIHTPKEYWNLLKEGRSGIIDIPSSRWNVEDFYDPDPDKPGKMLVKKGGFLQDDVSLFDADFFGISPLEAVDMDPQQRLALEVAWEAIEDAGINPKHLVKTPVAVYMGVGFNDYASLIIRSGKQNAMDHYYNTGNQFNVIAGRISFFFGLQGPSITLDTACSSSLVTVIKACEDLRAGKADMALAGGVSLILTPEPMVNFSKIKILSPDGTCKVFDAQANGMGRGEGCGIVVLKRLSDAISSNDRIYGVIRGIAINHGGQSSGLTVPNGRAEKELFLKALEDGELAKESVSYIETHGTGTPLGDPIEVSAISEAYGSDKRLGPLYIGSVKANIGHTESVAGIASLIKVALLLENKMIPKQLNFKSLNPKIDLSYANLKIPIENITIDSKNNPFRCGVSSFGFSGINAHMIVEEAPLNESKEVAEPSLRILSLSAKTETALDELIQKYLKFLDESQLSLADICYTANVGRKHNQFRGAVIFKDLEDLKLKLKNGDFLRGVVNENIPYEFIREENQLNFLEGLAKAYVSGAIIDWGELYAKEARNKVTLPTYPFQRNRYWVEGEHPSSIEKQKSKTESPFEIDELGLALEKSSDKLSTAVKFISSYLRNVLKLEKEKEIDPKKGFFDMGMDSLIAVDFTKMIQKSLGNRIVVKQTLPFDYSNVNKVAEYVLSELKYKGEKKTSVEDEVERMDIDKLIDEI